MSMVFDFFFFWVGTLEVFTKVLHFT